MSTAAAQDTGDGASILPFPGVHLTTVTEGTATWWFTECETCGSELMETPAGVDLCVECYDEGDE